MYEYADAEGGDADAQGKKFVINSQVSLHRLLKQGDQLTDGQNCIHCKTCSIKTPTQDITWAGELRDLDQEPERMLTRCQCPKVEVDPSTVSWI